MQFWSSLDWPSLIVGAVLGTIASTWYSFYLKRPVLKVVGSGGGGGPGKGHRNSLNISNVPGHFGINVQPSTIFGLQLHGSFQYGLVVDRNPANECSAHLYDKQSGQPIKPLWWRLPDGSYARQTTIESGKQATLMLFARSHDEPLKYFPFQPANSTNDIVIPPENEKLEGTRAFWIVLQHSYGRKSLRIDCRITKGFDGRLSFDSQGGGGSF